MRILARVALALSLSSPSAAVPASPPRLATETFLVPGSDPGVKLYVRNKHVAGRDAFPAERIVLFVHGATYPSESVFDVDLPGGSWMEHVARRGFDAYLVDVRGYGGSTRPPSMSAPAADNPPFATTDEAVRDVASAVDFILHRRHAARLSLVAWSWGTAIAAGYATENAAHVDKLVMYAPIWIFRQPPPLSGQGAYRSVNKETARQRSLRGIPEDRREDVSPTAWFDRWWAATLATDPEGARRDPPVLRAPNGVIKDLAERWATGKPTYDPAAIRVPTLVIGAEWDQDAPLYMSQELFGKIVNAPVKRHVVLGEGTHAVMLEKNRMQLVSEVQAFLEEAPPPPTVTSSR